ncbi:ankyrin repeat domain-containing protein [Pseudoxanthomonas winnipegensis]|uniref:Ankyrin repeat domain-containing protein n=1 Tax=Pseudoxanthomonas winnipegensis TaxID=2480810 RepID=A0A4Q8M2I5_9GAMM|nr:ankyrin repeat domain-containing protein [Pseudoxanthomonas winnipegensis]TAA41523.1 ankyrin repeat domain-containing protein [Pseudoxanthomonas winnipegensis]
MQKTIHQAATDGDLDAITYHCAHSDVNQESREYYTPLQLASKQGHTDVVHALIDAGADTNARHFGHWTPLMFAARNGHVDCMRMLINNHADIEAQDLTHARAIHHAAEFKHTDCVALLRDHQADIQAITCEKKDILDYAKSNKDQELLGYLEGIEFQQKPRQEWVAGPTYQDPFSGKTHYGPLVRKVQQM